MSKEKWVNLNVLMSKELKKEVEERAKELGMNMSSYVRFLLIQDLKK